MSAPKTKATGNKSAASTDAGVCIFMICKCKHAKHKSTVGIEILYGDSNCDCGAKAANDAGNEAMMNAAENDVPQEIGQLVENIMSTGESLEGRGKLYPTGLVLAAKFPDHFHTVHGRVGRLRNTSPLVKYGAVTGDKRLFDDEFWKRINTDKPSYTKRLRERKGARNGRGNAEAGERKEEDDNTAIRAQDSPWWPFLVFHPTNLQSFALMTKSELGFSLPHPLRYPLVRPGMKLKKWKPEHQKNTTD